MRIKRTRNQQRNFSRTRPPRLQFGTFHNARGGRGPYFPLLGAALGLLAISYFTFGLALAADQLPGSTVKGFKAPLDYCEPPHELQVRTYLEGSKSDMGANGTIVIWDAKLQTFHDDGSHEMLMNAPQCVYDYTRKIVTSAGPLHVQTWDDKSKRELQLQGSNGFYWQQTNSLLIVSNKQTTTISGSLTNSFTP